MTRGDAAAANPAPRPVALTDIMATLGIPALFAAGLLTFLSPCVLPLVPIYLAMLAGTSAEALREGSHRRRLVLATTAFALGIGVVLDRKSVV